MTLTVKGPSHGISAGQGSLLDVDTGIASIWVACIGGTFSLIAVVLQKFRAENKKDHDTVMAMLRLMRRAQDRTEDKVDKVSDRLTEHITKH